ncbi:MAG: DUF2795 domain-containing protein [Chloroflexota bacterium]
MTAIKWDDISGYVDEVFKLTGKVIRADVLELAEKDGVSDDIIDALDALGSRTFNTVADVKTFLVQQGYVAK